MRIICVGDSLTKGYKVSFKDTWPHLAGERLNIQCINKGIIGDTSFGVLSRLERDFFSLKPDRGIFMAGTNDLLYGVALENICAIMSTVVEHCYHYNILPYLGVPVLTAPEQARIFWGEKDFDKLNNKLKTYRDWIYTFSQEFKCPVLDFQNAFEEAKKTYQDSDLYLDGVHPTALGNSILANCIKI